MNNLSNKLPGLAIIRTICAFSILFGHFYQFGDWGNLELEPVALPEIYLPVVTFFVITGFLMAWTFLQEEDTSGDISIISSYKRRARRILPLYYIGIIVGLLALWVCDGKLDGDLWGLLTLQPHITHLLGTTPFPLWHYWFLGVEVTFYLLFPFLFKISRRHRLPIIVGVAFLWLLVKWSAYFFLGKGFVYHYLGMTQMDTILWGSAVAILFYKQQPWLIKICRSLWFTILAWALFLTTQLWVPLLPSLIRSLVIAFISIMVILSGFCGHPILENKVTHFFSKISYGIYIFHPIMIYVCAEGIKHLPLHINLIASISIVVVVTIGLATAMHKLVDR
ncbi:MAG: acyltransferase [Bacteroidaceae bacterium]|nr:acyltransferase [Bacteroidaceae bacterium]